MAQHVQNKHFQTAERQHSTASYQRPCLEQHSAALVHNSNILIHDSSMFTPSVVGRTASRPTNRNTLKAAPVCQRHHVQSKAFLICLLNYISSRLRLESPLSPRAIDTLALPRLTRGFVCCGRHSRLSPDGIYYVLCFNIHSVWVEINFSFGPNCLCALAAQGSTAPRASASPRCYSGSGPARPAPHTAVFYT